MRQVQICKRLEAACRIFPKGFWNVAPRQDVKTRIVVNHESLEQAVNELFTTKAFRQVKARRGSKWTARMLVTVALFWAWSGGTGLKERFQQAAKLAGKILRWLPDPGQTYQGFIKQLQKWHVKLQIACAANCGC